MTCVLFLDRFDRVATYKRLCGVRKEGLQMAIGKYIGLHGDVTLVL